MPKKISKEEVIEKFKNIHGDKYDYSLVEYKKMHDNVTIICYEHGEFKQTPHAHLAGQGCPKCGIESRSIKRKDDIDSFIVKSKIIHGDKYDYSRIEYVNSQTKVCIMCPKHGEFWQKPYSHIQGQGCPKCNEERLKSQPCDTKEHFIEKALNVHGDKYDYSKVEYVNSKTKVCIICPEHGEFWQSPNSHIQGQGCQRCGIEKTHIPMTTEEWIRKAKKVHGDEYDYSKSEYISPYRHITIICRKHGEFKQKSSYHLSGNGCPKCGIRKSSGETEIYEFVREYFKDAVHSCRDVLDNGMEIDIFIPSKNVGIEFDGLFWHSEHKKLKNYHINKTKECEKKGIRLIHIFEDEWIYKKEIVKSRIKNILGVSSNRIYARKCSIRNVSNEDAMNFLNNSHIQGGIISKYRLGLYYNNELVSLMTFGGKRKNLGSKNVEGIFELFRFCNKLDTVVIGAASKLLKHFIETYKPNEIISYCDIRWSDGNLYERIGFNLDHISQPNYFYVIGDERKNRFNYRKDKLISEGFDPNKTEHEIMLERGIYRIYDCGCKVYEMKIGF